MHPSRAHRNLGRLVLLWFLLWLGVAVAAPWMKPVPLDQQVCSGANGGIASLAKLPDDGAPGGDAHMDCPLCMPLYAPPPVAHVQAAQPQPLGCAMQPIPAARLAVATAMPPPLRGPPRLS